MGGVSVCVRVCVCGCTRCVCVCVCLTLPIKGYSPYKWRLYRQRRSVFVTHAMPMYVSLTQIPTGTECDTTYIVHHTHIHTSTQFDIIVVRINSPSS